MSDLTPDQIEFTNAFNLQRTTLAGFAKCQNQEELDIVRDAFYLGLARDLLPMEYQRVSAKVVTDSAVADTVGTSDSMANMIQSARTSPGWDDLIEAVHHKAAAVDSDLEGIWKTLEEGRLEWIKAVNGAHPIKELLKKTLAEKDSMEGDVSDAKMIWIYGVSLNLKQLQEHAATWARVAKISNPTQPLIGYKEKLWDPRLDEWRPLDLGVQAAAERGGSTLEEAWNA
mmetsp:Transcript_13092/g.19976  ORF Transcript_13092/g.19976 Transcript_13092/m.19976 type:complete len:228 (-) Transcript_13092:306-989(-)|eukprot:CAMPEP_0178926980 /NCGR_PEP_ID=MMETSP0786-20121207/18882_1 /TAXON_ID=186022 /ORGANISM="Thalassionema frauenfeldii, Strain CCMP 1798" /LENGTH=227 /DNA_ID=CAMNT_0020602259 /DNA_START=67 /DNA_END=750 /DNA_ORIENTATION=-